MSGQAPGRQLRERLAEFAVKKSGPAFYQLMSRMEDAGVVKGWYQQEIVKGQIIRERNYKITAQGRTAWHRSSEFYQRVREELIGAENPVYGR